MLLETRFVSRSASVARLVVTLFHCWERYVSNWRLHKVFGNQSKHHRNWVDCWPSKSAPLGCPSTLPTDGSHLSQMGCNMLRVCWLWTQLKCSNRFYRLVASQFYIVANSKQTSDIPEHIAIWSTPKNMGRPKVRGWSDTDHKVAGLYP